MMCRTRCRSTLQNSSRLSLAMYILYLYSITSGSPPSILSAECNDITSFGLPRVRHRRHSFRCDDRLDCSGGVQSTMSSDPPRVFRGVTGLG